jgi:hypothetical protein
MKSVQFSKNHDFTMLDHSSNGEIHSVNISFTNLDALYRIYPFLVELNFDLSLDKENNIITIGNLSVYNSKDSSRISFVNFLNLQAVIRLDDAGHYFIIEKSEQTRTPLFTPDREMAATVSKTANHRRELFLQRKKV